MPKVAFLFPGQGAQAVGMGKELWSNHSAVRDIFEKANGILGYDLAEVCFYGPADRLNATEVCQPAIFVASWAALEVLRGQQPDLVNSCQAAAGLSLGEYTALAFAQALSFEDALGVVQFRGQMMQAAAERTPGGMASMIGLTRDQVEAICAQLQDQPRVWVANLLGPANIVVSGERTGIEAVRQLVQSQASARMVPLEVAGAFHTELMQPADAQLAGALQNVAWHPLRIPVVSNVDASWHQDSAEIVHLLVRQVVSRVLWEQSMNRLLNAGFDRFYEIGPGRVLKGLLRRIHRKAHCENVPA